MCVTEFSLTTNITDILASRLRNTGLTGAPFASASGAVAGLLAVQAQDYAAAKWSLGMRVEGSTDVSIENAFNDGAILRTHVLRPTWHFVTPENIRWMLELTAPHVKARMAPYDLKLELDEALLAKTNDAIENSLKSGSPVTRGEIKTALDRIGVATDVQRLAHIVMRAELNGLICSGPRRGKRFTYAPMDGRASKAKRLSREEALSRLALGYFLGHGPAQLADFAWWSGLPVKAAREGLELARGQEQSVTAGLVNHRPHREAGVVQVGRVYNGDALALHQHRVTPWLAGILTQPGNRASNGGGLVAAFSIGALRPTHRHHFRLAPAEHQQTPWYAIRSE